jgi:isoleucyl-tRNA synthetase
MYKIPPNPSFGKGGEDSQHPMDEYILARLRDVRLQVGNGFDNLQLDQACKPIDKFIDDFSVWYLRRSRDRLKEGNVEAIQTLQKVLFEFAKILALIMPFMAEIVYQSVKKDTDLQSVHLEKWTEDIDKNLTKREIEIVEQMQLVREIVSVVLDERVKAGIKVRQPLQSINIHSEKYVFLKNSMELQAEIRDEVNVREIKFEEEQGSSKALTLDLNISEELKKEGIMREITRLIQDKRKEIGLKVSDIVAINLPNTLSPEEKEVVKEFEDKIKKECGLREIGFGESLEITR